MAVKIHTEIVNGICPECEEYTMLVGITRTFYKCVRSKAKLEENIDGTKSIKSLILE